ncbi:carbohydrate-binding module family 20 domain-containing protein [Streptomyces sp. NPDC048361]|uniref:carbohydrate-binding module family 20 domain-containing protein n=1 Tax=Streptomyces sp. NPDC048361 TaxID=3154720 RepID=UPI00344A6EF5
MTETFHETATVPAGQKVYLVGSPAALASWNTKDAVPLTSSDGTHWSATAGLPANASFEDKYILKDAQDNVTWEPGANRTASSGTSGTTLNDTWK